MNIRIRAIRTVAYISIGPSYQDNDRAPVFLWVSRLYPSRSCNLTLAVAKLSYLYSFRFKLCKPGVYLEIAIEQIGQLHIGLDAN